MNDRITSIGGEDDGKSASSVRGVVTQALARSEAEDGGDGRGGARARAGSDTIFVLKTSGFCMFFGSHTLL